MSKRWLGGIVSGTAPTITGPLDGDGGNASGLWSIEQAQNLNAAGKWPKPKIAGSLYGWGYGANGQLGIDPSGLTGGSFTEIPGQQIGFGTEGIQVGNWSSVSAGNSTMAIKIDGTLWAWGLNSYGQLGQNDVVLRSSPTQVGASTWSSVSGGSSFIIAIKTDGTLWSWGRNNYGQLGQNNVTYRSSPVQVGALTNWLSVSVGYRYAHTAAIKTDGTLWAWGYNPYGQLGQNNVTYRSSPVQVGSGTTWASVSTGYDHTAAIKTDGTLWTWGYNDFYGMLGQNNLIFRSSPVQVGSGTTWSKVSAGSYHTVAIKTDGTLWVWGYNPHGGLGQNDTVNRSSPVQVGSGTNWSSVFAGGTSTAAIKTDGTLWSWGYNNHGQLGQNDDSVNRSSPVQVGSGTTWSKASAGQYNIEAIKTDGTLWAWGYGYYGALGQNDVANRSSPVQVGSTVVAYNNSTAVLWNSISIGRDSAFAIKSNGTLWSWGSNAYGQLGYYSTATRLSPVQVGALTDWSSVSAGKYQTLAIKTNGTLWTWGYGSLGELGISDITINISSPTQVGSGTTWASIAVGTQVVLATKTDGTLWSWGGGGFGQLGLGDTADRSSPTQVGALTNWSSVAAGYIFSLATKTDGTLWAWGYNAYGQLGQNNFTYRSSPVQIGLLTTWSKPFAGYAFSGATKTDGTLWTWGGNTSGQLGQGTSGATHISSPTQVGSLTNWSKITGFYSSAAGIKTDGTLWTWGQNAYGQLGLNVGTANITSPTQLGTSTNWASIANTNGIDGYFFAGINTSGSLFTWGYNNNGQLGQNDYSPTVYRSSPVQVGGTPSVTAWNRISISGYSLGIKVDGTLWGWGLSVPYGVLGLNDTVNRSSPVQVGSLTTWSSVSAGGVHSSAIKTDGTLWTWGYNSSGQLGLGNQIPRSSPTQVGSLTTWSSVSNGYQHTAAIKTDGTLWTWGYNSSGQLGLGNQIPRSSPTQVGSLTDWSSVSAGYDYTAAIKTDGTLWTWGYNNLGQLGQNDTANRSSPVQVGSGTTWSKVSAGYYTTAAIKTDGTLWIWGYNAYGQLGQNNATNRSSPTQIGALTNWSSVSAGQYFTIALKTDGTLWAWGNNDYSVLGLGTTHYNQGGGGSYNEYSSPTQVGNSTKWTRLPTCSQSTNFLIAISS